MKTRFELEQELMDCWGIVDDVKLLHEQVMEDDQFDKDRISNYLLGLDAIYDAKFEKLFATFEGLVAQNKIT